MEGKTTWEELVAKTENSNWQTFLKIRENFFKVLKDRKCWTDGKLKLLQITYHGCDVIDIIYEADISSRSK